MNETTTNTTPGWTGRADYAERREARIERLQDSAERHEAASTAAYDRAHAAVDGIPFGQPNINGCLTPAYNRHDAAMRTSIRESGKADAMLDMALRVSAMSGRAVIDALACVPHESSYAQKTRGEKPAPIVMRARFAVHGKIVVIDNCIASGVTASAALAVIPNASVYALTISNWRKSK